MIISYFVLIPLNHPFHVSSWSVCDRHIICVPEEREEHISVHCGCHGNSRHNGSFTSTDWGAHGLAPL